MPQIRCRRDRAGCTFGAIPFWEVLKRTPEDLKQRPNAMYVSIAIPWCDAPHLKVSCRLLLRQLPSQLAHGSTNKLDLDTSRRLWLRQQSLRPLSFTLADAIPSNVPDKAKSKASRVLSRCADHYY